jgi:imidazolonepropionase-like amidohydrolase
MGALLAVWLLALGHADAVRGATLRLAQARLHPITGPVLTNASLLIRDGRIAALETGESGPPADETVNLAGAHVYPGLIAPTTVLGLVDIEGVRASRDTTEVGEFRPDLYAWMAVHPDSDLIPVARANGYTHVQTVPLGGVVSGQSAVLALSGWTIEDLAIRRTAGLHVFWPGFALDVTPREGAGNREGVKTPEEQARERDRKVRRIEEFFADAEAYATARKSGVAGFQPVPAWEAMVPVLKGEVAVFLHADEVRQIRSAVEWAVRRRLRVVLAGGRDAWRLPELLVKHSIPVAYEDVFTEPLRDEDPYDVHFAAPGVLARAGVKVAFAGGSDRFGASNLRNVPYAAAQAVAFGMPREEALRGLTLHGAEMLGLQDRLGSLEPGKEASLFVADGDILDVRTRVIRMWIAGREASLESKHTRLYERYRGRPRGER